MKPKHLALLEAAAVAVVIMSTTLTKQATKITTKYSDELTFKILGTKTEWCAKCNKGYEKIVGQSVRADSLTCIWREVHFMTWSMIDECGRDQRVEMDSEDWRFR